MTSLPSNSSSSSLSSLLPLLPHYESLLADNLSLLVDRHRAEPGYPFINTKLNLITGEDFAARSRGLDIYSRGVVYGWTQGRGLEALAAHLAWLPHAASLPDERKRDLIEGMTSLLGLAVKSMERIRARNGGRLSYMMSATDGTPLTVADDGQAQPLDQIAGAANFSDLFYAKGLFLAARALDDLDLATAAVAYYRQVVDAILAGQFVTDQITLDPKNRASFVPGRHSHGPAMIALGGVALLLEARAGAVWADYAVALTRRVLDRHVNRGQFAALQPWDFVEFLDDAGQPWHDGAAILCDPGHALEFIGLASKVLLTAATTDQLTAPLKVLSDECQVAFPALLPRIFSLGYNPTAGGICKAVDLVTRQPLNSDMPWWNLPETLRACALVLALWPDLDPAPILDVYGKVHTAFFGGYVNPHVYGMAVQTRDVGGQPVDVIPGVPDADPCYHTGASLLDVLAVLQPPSPVGTADRRRR